LLELVHALILASRLERRMLSLRLELESAGSVFGVRAFAADSASATRFLVKTDYVARDSSPEFRRRRNRSR
jgi:hypothetical protein